MGNPGSTITITLEALTEQANAKVISFLAGLDAKLNASMQKAALAESKFFITPTNPGLRKILDDIVDGANKAKGSLAGMSYYFRSAIDGVRLAAAGGGARAGFYAIDEAVRGLIASGLGLSTLVPIIGAVAAAVGSGYLVWREWTSGEREAEKAAKDLHTQMEGLAKIFVQLRDLQKAGLLSPQAVQQNLDYLSGKKQLYKNHEGQLTSSPTEVVPKFVTNYAGPGVGVQTQVGTETVALQKANALEVQKYIQDNIAVQGKLDQSQVDASVKHGVLLREVHTQALIEAEQEKAAIHEKYQAQREEIAATSSAMGTLLTPQGKKDNDAALALSLQNEASEKAAVDFRVQEENRQKAQEAAAKSQEMFAEMVRKENEDLDRALTLSAAQQGKTRADIYQEEYKKRLTLLEGQLYAGEISEKDYTKAVEIAEIQRLEGLKREEEALRRLAALKAQLAQRDYDSEKKSVEQNPFLTGQQKNQQLGGIIANQIGDLQGQLAQNLAAKPADTQQQIQNLEQRKELQSQLNALLLEQRKLLDQTGLVNDLKSAWTSFYDTVADTSKDLANFLVSPFKGLRDGIAQSLETIIEKGGSMKSFFIGIGQSIEKSMIQSFANMAADWITKMAMVALRWLATQIFMTTVHSEQTAIRTGIHVLGEIAMTVASLAQSLIRRVAAFLEAQPYIFLAAVKAATAVADIPYVGPILAPIAAATTFAALEALAVFREGGYTGDGPPGEVAGLVHRGEFVIPAERVQQNLGFLQAIHSGRFSASSINGASAPHAGDTQAGAGGPVVQHKTELNLATFGGEADAKRWAESNDGETWFHDMMNKHAYKFQRT